jgi:hypothetical protein
LLLLLPAAAAAAAGFVGNPPWQVSTELYQELLLPAGEQF